MGIAAGTAMLLSSFISAGVGMYTAARAPDAPPAPEAIPQIIDKTVPEEQELLGEVQIGDDNSLKQKRQSAKTRFKVEKTETGTSTLPTGTTGVQI